MQTHPQDKKQLAKEGEEVEKNEQKQQDVIGEDVGQIEAGRGDFHNLVDILFVLDTTGSMGWCIKECKKTIKKIIKKFSDKQYNIKFAIDLYRDHPPQEYSYIEKHFDLRNEQEIMKVLDNDCDAAGGGDTPEAVMDGLYQGLKKTSWRIGTDGITKSKRFLFHCCDAPPHGKEYGSSSTDKTWEQKGCPCGITKLDIQGLLVENKVDYSLLKVGTSLDLMQSLFKECFSTRFKKVMPLEINQNKHKASKSKKKKVKEASDVSEDSLVEMEEDYDRPELMRCMAMDMDLECESKAVRRSTPRKVLKKKKVEYSASEDEDEGASQSGDDEKEKGLGRKRSMASLVCSEVESGLSDYQKELAEVEKEEKK